MQIMRPTLTGMAILVLAGMLAGAQPTRLLPRLQSAMGGIERL
jgi:hypothetical protein